MSASLTFNRIEPFPLLKITKDMLDLAKHIVEQKSGHFDSSKFEDRYETALQELLEKKQKAQPIAKMAPRRKSNVVNLMDALRQPKNHWSKRNGPGEEAEIEAGRKA